MISRLVLAELARSLDHQAEEADDAEQAIAAAVSGRFDVMLVDLSMPEVDGFEILRRLREREATLGRPALPVIAVTGHVEPEDHARTRAAGFAGHLDKPVLRPNLEQMLAKFTAAG
jgi:CheY-like chemotaxis protein